jgi:hypothetical protein
MARKHLAACACVALVAAAAPSGATAKARNCGNLARPGTTYRVIALRGVSCKTAKRIATLDASSTAPAPWKCQVGLGKKYAGKEIGSMCGYGGHGSLLKRPHAFVTVILHNLG